MIYKHALEILPQITGNLVDKILVLQAFNGGIPEEYRPRGRWKEYREIVYSELPAFLHHLNNLEVGDEGKGRFAVANYQAPEILRRMKTLASSPKGVDLLSVAGDGVEGTAGALFEIFSKRIPQLKALCKNSSKVFGRFYLSPLVKNVPERAKVRVLDGYKIYTLTGAG